MPQVYVRDDIYHRVVRLVIKLGKTGSRTEVLELVDTAIEEKLQNIEEELQDSEEKLQKEE